MPLLSPYLLWGPPFIFFSYFGVFGDLILGAVKRHNLRRRATLLPTFVLRSGSLCVDASPAGKLIPTAELERGVKLYFWSGSPYTALMRSG